MAALDQSSSSIGRGCFRKRPSDDQENPCLAEEKSTEFVNRVCQVTLEAFWTQKVKGKESFDRTDSMLAGLGAGWTASFLAKIYPSLS